GAARVQVGGAAHGQMLAAGQDAVVVEAGFLQTAQGFVVHGDAAFTTGGRLAPATLGFDQLAYAVGTVTDDFGRAANGGGDHFIADDHDAQVQPRMEAFQQHALVELAGAGDGVLDVLGGAQVHRDSVALFAIDGLDHQAAVLVQEGGVVFGGTRQTVGGQIEARAGK